jgi:hypothetical protein
MLWCVEGIEGSDAPQIAINLQKIGRTVLRFPWPPEPSDDGFYEVLRLAWYLSIAKNSAHKQRYVLWHPLDFHSSEPPTGPYTKIYKRLREKILIAYDKVCRLYVYTDPVICAKRRGDASPARAICESDALWNTYFVLTERGKRAFVI